MTSLVDADDGLLRSHCGQCHSGVDPEGGFLIEFLGDRPTRDNIDWWNESLDRVESGEMPPEDETRLSEEDRQKMVDFLALRANEYSADQPHDFRIKPRRLNNREFANSVRDVLFLEDVGTHQPTDNLIGDSLHEGFDTHGDTLGFSNFHLEQYISSLREIVDATILTGSRPESRVYRIRPTRILSAHTSQNTTRPERRGDAEGFDFLDPRQLAYFENFPTVPQTGWYKIKIQCTGKDRGYYDSAATGVYDGDPIRLNVLLGDRVKSFALPDEDVHEVEMTEWLAADSRVRLQYPTDGLKLRGNGNFKFQNAIAGEHIKQHDPELYDRVVANAQPRNNGVARSPSAWQNWVEYWRGPRPRIFNVVVEGPFYESWPPVRQIKLLGESPTADNAELILIPIAERAWRRRVAPEELTAIVKLVEDRAGELGDIGALKEGIVAIMASPNFLIHNLDEMTDHERFAAKVSYFLGSTIPDEGLKESVRTGKLDSFSGIRAELLTRIEQSKTTPFERAFPYAWLHLNDINFMAPDPDRFRHYHRKDISEDMSKEVLTFFEYALAENIPITEFLSADYSFINADLAVVYGVSDVPADSVLRKYVFEDGRRGGLLGTGAFLTITADSLATSPIHRAVYVMENFLGTVPAPPPADVEIEEPDIRSAKTIREVLDAHRSDESCASCHRGIDPYGYAFENFDSMGAWRDAYSVLETTDSSNKNAQERAVDTPIDASSRFTNGDGYQDIVEFRRLMMTPKHRERFVHCFVHKLLTYANGEEPRDYAEIERIVAKASEHDYQIVETIAAVIDSPLFRERRIEGN